MDTKRTKPKSGHRDAAVNRSGSMVVSAHTMLAWGRIPSRSKAEIIEAFEHASPVSDANIQTFKTDTQLLKIRNMSSGLRVVYEYEQQEPYNRRGQSRTGAVL